MDTDIFIAAVLDRSGSMGMIWPATVEAFDGFVAEQAKVGKGWISLTHFDDEIKTPHRAWGLADMPKLKDMKKIYPRGSTAMYDAIGEALGDADKWLHENAWFTGTKLCMIQTDGHENASRKWSQKAIFKLIREHEANGWTFVYLGANQDAWAVAQSMGISTHDSTLTYDHTAAGTAGSYAAMTASTTSLRSGGGFTNLNPQQSVFTPGPNPTIVDDDEDKDDE